MLPAFQRINYVIVVLIAVEMWRKTSPLRFEFDKDNNNNNKMKKN